MKDARESSHAQIIGEINESMEARGVAWHMLSADYRPDQVNTTDNMRPQFARSGEEKLIPHWGVDLAKNIVPKIPREKLTEITGWEDLMREAITVCTEYDIEISPDELKDECFSAGASGRSMGYDLLSRLNSLSGVTDIVEEGGDLIFGDTPRDSITRVGHLADMCDRFTDYLRDSRYPQWVDLFAKLAPYAYQLELDNGIYEYGIDPESFPLEKFLDFFDSLNIPKTSKQPEPQF